MARKIFHVCVFSGAVPAHLLQGFWGVVLYGTIVSVVVLFGYRKGPGFPLYEILSRPSDGEDSRRLIIVPLLATAAGGLTSALLVGQMAAVGYLVCGWGDAAGELVGNRWGRHRYGSVWGGDTERNRSIEGSLAVLFAGSLGAGTVLWLLGFPFQQILAGGAAAGTIGALAEGLSGPGTDNFWVQVAPSLLLWWLLR